MVICLLCNKEFKRIEGRHLKVKHGMSMPEYKQMFPNADITSIETSRKVSAANEKRWKVDVKYREKMTLRMTGKNNIVHSITIDPKQRSETAKELWQQEDYRSSQLAVRFTERWRENNRNNAVKAFSKFWSDSGWLKDRSDAIKGENNPNWVDGGTVDRKRYYGPNWKEQKKLIRSRDHYICQICSITELEVGQALDVHHITPFREFNYDPEKNNNYVFANHPSNLILLCHSCHMIAERS